MRKLLVISVITLCNFSLSAMAELTSQQCGFDNAGFLPITPNSDESPIDVKADNVLFINDGISTFTGDVEVLRGGQELKSDQATYNKTTGEVTAQGHVQIRDSDIILNSDQADWSMVNDDGTMTDAHYRLREGHARGQAKHVYRKGKMSTDLKNATYTTCPLGDNAWVLQSSHVELDHVKAVGEARNVIVRLGNVPVFYTPYISFPLSDERKSGFLTPSIGSTGETGFDLSTPYYWNISPDKDATITPRYMSNRGLMFNGEFRYLSNQYKGTMNAGFLAGDNLRQSGSQINPYFNQDRKYFSWKHDGNLSSRWRANVDYNYVSDKNYITDFSSSLSLASTTYINRLLNVGYYADNWNVTGRLQGYQTISAVTKPYQQLPKLRFQGSLPNQAMGLTYAMTAEYVNFDHESLVSGQRIDLEPSVSLPWRSSAAFVTPRLALHHTRYDLNANGTSIVDSSPTRTLPVTSIDSGLFFERELNFSSSRYTQTLEPRAFYLYIPERNQSNIPLFDTGLRTFSMGQLFSYDRFSGVDRIGDANQLSLALTSRIIDQKTGREKVHLTLGQIRYFSNRKVTLNNTAAETQSDSDIVAEIAAEIAQNWSTRGEIQWDPQGVANNMSALSLTYRGNDGRLLNVSHRYRRNSLEQVDISARIPFNKQWSMVGRWYHSIKDHRTLEGLAGIEYDSCCWATRFVVRNYVNSATSLARNLAFFFQIELKGLGNFGQDTDTLLKKSILGYGS